MDLPVLFELPTTVRMQLMVGMLIGLMRVPRVYPEPGMQNFPEVIPITQAI